MYLYCFSSNTRLSILSFSPSPAFLVFIAESCYRFRICHQHLGSADNYSLPQQKHVHPHMQQYVKCNTCTNRLIYIVHTREVVFFVCVRCPFCTCTSGEMIWFQTKLLSPKWVESQPRLSLCRAGGTLQFCQLFTIKLSLHFCLFY